MLIVPTNKELRFQFVEVAEGDAIRLQGLGGFSLVRVIIKDNSKATDKDKAHIDAIQLIFRATGQVNAQFALGVMYSILIDGCHIQAPTSMMQGIFASDGIFKDVIIKNCIINNRSPHKITINGYHSGFISNNLDPNGKLLPVTLNPARVAGGHNLWIVGYKDQDDEPRPLSEIIDPKDGYDHVTDNRKIITRPFDTHLTDFDLKAFREQAVKIPYIDTPDLCEKLFNLALECGRIITKTSEIKKRKLGGLGASGVVNNSFKLLEETTMNDAPNKRVIWEVQRRLAIRGLYKARIDGIDGNQTQEAIRDFQALEDTEDNWLDLLNTRVAEMRPSTMRNEEEFIYEMVKLCRHFGLDLPAQWAYIAATVKHETAGTFAPIEEGSTAGWSDSHLKKWQSELRYAPFHGRNFSQVTWESNYEKFTRILQPYDDKHGDDQINFVKHPELMLDPEVGLFILVHGFKTGAFRKNQYIERYINEGSTDFNSCRLCINGYRKGEALPDKAALISRYAKEYLSNMEQY